MEINDILNNKEALKNVFLEMDKEDQDKLFVLLGGLADSAVNTDHETILDIGIDLGSLFAANIIAFASNN